MNWLKKAIQVVTAVVHVVNTVVEAITGQTIQEHVQSWFGGGDSGGGSSSDSGDDGESVPSESEDGGSPTPSTTDANGDTSANPQETAFNEAQATLSASKEVDEVTYLDDDAVPHDWAQRHTDGIWSLRIRYRAMHDDQVRPFLNWAERDLGFVESIADAFGVDGAFQRLTGYDPNEQEISPEDVLTAARIYKQENDRLTNVTLGDLMAQSAKKPIGNALVSTELRNKHN